MNATQVRLAQTAKRLIEKHGREIILIKPDKTSQDVDKPWRVNNDPSDSQTKVTVKAIFYNPKSPSQLGQESALIDSLQGRLDKALFDSKFKWCMFAADSAPGHNFEEFGYVSDGGALWKIVHFETLQISDNKIIYQLKMEQ